MIALDGLTLRAIAFKVIVEPEPERVPRSGLRSVHDGGRSNARLSRRKEGDVKMPGPMKPSEVRRAKAAAVPEEVFVVVNRLLAEAWDGHGATVKQRAILDGIMHAMSLDESEVYRRHLLDFEEAYRALGWRVEYDKPGYNETYPATFTFTQRRMRPGEVGDEDG